MFPLNFEEICYSAVENKYITYPQFSYFVLKGIFFLALNIKITLYFSISQSQPNYYVLKWVKEKKPHEIHIMKVTKPLFLHPFC